MTMQFEDFSRGVDDHAAAEAVSPQERLQHLIDNAPAIIYSAVASGDFKLTFVSNNAYHILGYRPESMVADPNFWFDHIHPDDAPHIFPSLAQVFVEGERTYEYRFRAADGSYRWMHDTLRLVRDRHGAPQEVIGSLTDITARKAAEQSLANSHAQQLLLIERLQQSQQQLIEAEKMASIGQLAAGVAHEINHPIGFVTANMGALKTYLATLFDVIAQYEAGVAAHAAGPALLAHIAALPTWRFCKRTPPTWCANRWTDSSACATSSSHSRILPTWARTRGASPTCMLASTAPSTSWRANCAARRCSRSTTALCRRSIACPRT